MDRIEGIVRKISKLEPQEFIGICKILGVQIYREEERTDEEGKVKMEIIVRPAEDLLQEVIDKVGQLNRTRRRNFNKLLRAATKGR